MRIIARLKPPDPDIVVRPHTPLEEPRPLTRAVRIAAFVIATSFATTAIAISAPIADGSTAAIGRGANGYPCAASKSKYDAYQAALLTHRKYAKLAAMQDGVFLERGEHVRIVRHTAGAAPAIELRIVTGHDAGKSCWIDVDVDEAFVNVRAPHRMR